MRRPALPLILLLSGCAHGAPEIPLPPLCPSTSAAREIGQMDALIRGRGRGEVVAHYGAPARISRDEEIAMDKLVWGPLAIAYRRDDGRTVAMTCEVEMYASADAVITRVIWTLMPPERSPDVK